MLLNGRVKNLENDISDVLIVNLNSKKSTITDSLGLFTIEVKLKDSIRISAIQYLAKEIIISDINVVEKTLEINLVENVINLNEVTITPYNLTGKIDFDIDRLGIKPAVSSSSLGLPNANVQKMAQSERLLLEADRGKYIMLATTEEYGEVFKILAYAGLTVVINTHKIMNRASGRTKSLEEMVGRDKKTEIEKDIISKFSKKTISENFNIPEAQIDGFLTYCLSQADFLKLNQVSNSVEMWDYLKAKSIEYKEQGFSKE